MDWDDEDEQTAIYDKAGEGDVARSLLEGGGPPPAPAPAAGAPAPAMPPGRVSVPAPPTRPLNRPPPSQTPALAPQPAASPQLAPAPGRKTPMVAVAGVVAVVGVILAALLIAFWPRTGALIVTVSGPGNKPLDAVEIMVNSEKKCSSSPCTIEGLKADTYYVRAHAAGYQAMADIAVVVTGGGKAVQNMTLVRAIGTGLKVIGEGTGLKLYVDGREVGPLPQDIKDMEPGEHVIRVAGSERFEAFEKRVTVEPEQMQTIGPLKLRVLKGLATIVAGPGSDGSKVILISGSDRRTLPRLPITLDIPTTQAHTLVATRHGFQQFKLAIKFDDGQVEKTFEVAMVELGAAPAPGGGGSGERRQQGGGEQPAPRPGGGGGGGGEPAGSGAATLNINSIPVSNIILDGRPVGPTPKVGVRVGAGPHTVVFVKGTERKSATVSVGAGQTKTVAVRF
jgi:serine/threonine-protein kinase